MPERVNHHMVTLARDVRAVTQEELANRMQVGQGTLSKYENGVLDIPDDFVPLLSRALSFPREFFYQGGQPYGFPAISLPKA